MTKQLTKNQSLVLDVLVEAGTPLSAYTILDRLRNEGFRAPLQIYRALDQLVAHGHVHRLESMNSFVACRHPHHHHHGMTIFAICEQCGHIDEFCDEAVEQGLGQWARDNSFAPRKTSLEMRGCCMACTSTQA